MDLSSRVADTLLNAGSKALATQGPEGINVVPVSSVKIVDGKIWLINYFLGKTLTNLRENPAVALVFWQGHTGCQKLPVTDWWHVAERNAASWFLSMLRNIPYP